MLGFGMAALGRPQYININPAGSAKRNFNLEEFKDNGKKFLQTVYASGIWHFDTAPGYGIAEQMLSEWVQEKNPGNLILSSKWGYAYVADFDPNAKVHEHKEHSINRLNEQWKETSRLLPKLNIYQIHSATLDTGVLENEVILHRLHELRQERRLQIGITTSGADQNEIIKKALDIEIGGHQLFDSYQVTYNVFDQSLSSQLRSLKDKNLIIKEAMANGRVFPNKKFRHYAKAQGIIKQLSEKYNVGLDAIALRFVLDTVQPFSVLSGVTQQTHLTQNLKALDFQLEAEEINQLKAVKMDPNQYWEDREHLTWN